MKSNHNCMGYNQTNVFVCFRVDTSFWLIRDNILDSKISNKSKKENQKLQNRKFYTALTLCSRLLFLGKITKKWEHQFLKKLPECLGAEPKPENGSNLGTLRRKTLCPRTRETHLPYSQPEVSAVPLYCRCGVAATAALRPAAGTRPLLPHPRRWKPVAASVRVTTGLVVPVRPAE